jgi:hypothetical protein
MRLFNRGRKPIEPLNVDPIAVEQGAGAQDNAPGPAALDYEAIEDKKRALDQIRSQVGGRYHVTEADRLPDGGLGLEKDPADD